MWIEIQNSTIDTTEKISRDFITWYEAGVLVGRYLEDNGRESKRYIIQSKKFSGPIPQGSVVSEDDTLFVINNE